MVFPSLYESYGLSLNEGLATAKICVASGVGGHNEQIKNNKNGILVKDGRYIKAILDTEQNPKLQGKIMKFGTMTAIDIQELFKNITEVIR